MNQGYLFRARDKETRVEEDKFDFERLIVYQKGLEYIDFVYQTTNRFPKNEIFCLTDQFRRASSSICFNIAEGSGGSKAEFIQFLKIARRSARECVAIAEVAFRQQYISQTERKKEIQELLLGAFKHVEWLDQIY